MAIRFKFTPLNILGFVAFLGSIIPLQAQNDAIFSTGTFTGASSILTVGTLDYAVDFGSSTAVTVTDAGSTGATITFAAGGQTGLSSGATLTATNTYGGFDTVSSGNTGFDSVLDSAAYGNGSGIGSAETLTLTGLTAGQTYEMQILVLDTRGYPGRTVALANPGDDSSSGYVEYAYSSYPSGSPLGAEVTATFVADGTTQSFLDYGSVSGPQINALILDAVNPVTYTWTGAGDGTFDNTNGTSSPSNYTGGTGSAFPTSIDTAVFNVTSHDSVGFTQNDSVGTLVFGGNGANSSSYTFGTGYSLTVNDGLYVGAGVSGATETFNNTTNLGAGITVANGGSNTVLNFSNITGIGGGLTLQGGQAYGSDPAGGRTINVTGVISGGGAVTANLAGATADFQNLNTYTGSTTVNSGILEYTGTAASGTPFGTGSLDLNGGKLLIAPGGSGAIALTGATASGSNFVFGPSGVIQLTAPAGGSVTYTIGSGSGSVFTSTGSFPTLIIETSTAATLGTTENLVVNGTAPTVTNGIVGADIVGESASNGFGSFLTYGAVGTTGFSDYVGATPLIGTSGAPATGGSNSTNYTVDSAGAVLSGGFNFNTLTVTDGTVSGGTLQGTNGSGLLLNNATITSYMSFGNAGYIYVAGNSSVAGFDSNRYALPIFGPGTLTLTAATGGNQYYIGSFDLDGPGAVSASNIAELSGGTGQDTVATIAFQGGTLDTTATFAMDANNGGGTSATPVTVGSGGGTFDVASNTTLAVTGVISGAGPLDKTDSGTLISTGNNTFTGPLTIGAVNYQAIDSTVTNPSTTSGGTVLLTGTNTQILTTVAGNGTIGSSVLGGTGTITSTNNTTGQSSGIFAMNGGSIAPGIINPNNTSGLTGLSAQNQSSASAGILTFTGAGSVQSSVNLANAGNFEFTLADEKDNATGTAGTDFSQLSLTGNTILQLGGSSTLTVNLLSGISPTDSFWDTSHTWQIIIETGGATSDGTTFASITDPNYANGTFTDVNDGDGIELEYTPTAAVPEPSTVALFSLGLAGIGILAWRKRGAVLGLA